MNLTHLTKPAEPWLHLLVAPEMNAWQTVRALEGTPRLQVAVRTLRGACSATTDAFFDECAAALQFPPHFGANWDAFRDCMADLDGVNADAVILLFTDAERLLERASAAQRKNLAEVLGVVARERNQPAKPRKPEPFHVLFHAEPGAEAAVVERWSAAGLTLDRLG